MICSANSYARLLTTSCFDSGAFSVGISYSFSRDSSIDDADRFVYGDCGSSSFEVDECTVESVEFAEPELY